MDQTAVDNNSSIDFKDVPSGSITGTVTQDKNIQQNFYLVLKSDVKIMCSISITLTEIPGNSYPIGDPRSVLTPGGVGDEPTCSPPPKRNYLFTFLVIIVLILAGFFVYYYFFTEQKSTPEGKVNRTEPEKNTIERGVSESKVNIPVVVEQNISVETPMIVEKNLTKPEPTLVNVRTEQNTSSNVVSKPQPERIQRPGERNFAGLLSGTQHRPAQEGPFQRTRPNGTRLPREVSASRPVQKGTESKGRVSPALSATSSNLSFQERIKKLQI